MREIVPGTDPGFITYDVGAVLNEVTATILYTLTDGGFRLNTFFDWVVTAQYWDPITSTTLDSDNSLVCRANVPVNAFSIYGNQLVNSVFNWTTQNTKTALNALDAPFAGVPTPGLKTWIKRQIVPYNSGSQFASGGTQIAIINQEQIEATASKTNNVTTAIKLNTYYKLTFTTPNDTFDNITVYRRLYNQPAAAGTQSGVAKYYGLGAWEKIEIPRASITKAAGVYTLNLRGPLHPEMFNRNYNPSVGGSTLYESYYGPSGNWPLGSSTVINSVYPYYGAGNANSNTVWVEFLLAIKDVGVLSTQAARLTDFSTSGSGPEYRQEIDGFVSGNVSKLAVVNLADYNTFTAGYNRNLNEAITNIALNKLIAPPVFNGGNITGFAGAPFRFNYSSPNVNISANWIYLSGPDGVTVY
jgi:hypothetical protein